MIPSSLRQRFVNLFSSVRISWVEICFDGYRFKNSVIGWRSLLADKGNRATEQQRNRKHLGNHKRSFIGLTPRRLLSNSSQANSYVKCFDFMQVPSTEAV